MAEVEDDACGPPVFEGDPEAEEVSSSFSWHDLLAGAGEYCVDKHAISMTRWKQMSSTSKNGVSVTTFSRSLEEKGGMCEFLIRGSLPIARDTYFCSNADMEYRPEWDETCVSITELSSSGPGPEAGPNVERDRVLHWNVNYPWPLGKRDYVLEQRVLSGVHTGGKIFRCTQGRTVDPEVGKRLRPCEKGVTRIEDYRANFACWSGKSEQESNFALLYFEDGKLSVPNWVITKAAATTIPSQLAGFVAVSAKYPKKRLQHMLTRFGVSSGAGESPAGQDDEEAFFSASDNDSPTPARSKLSRVPRSPVPAAASKAALDKSARSPVAAGASKVAVGKPPAAAKKTRVVQAKDRKMGSRLESALRLVLPQPGNDFQLKEKENDSEEDLEEGVLIVGREERDLLLGLLAEARANQAGGWWRCCLCRRRCGRKTRSK